MMRRIATFISATLALMLVAAGASPASESAISQEASLQLGYDDNVAKSYVDRISDGVARLAYGFMLHPSLFKSASLNIGYGLGVKKYLSEFERDTIVHKGALSFEFSSDRVFGGFNAEGRYRGIRNGLRNYKWGHAGSFIGFFAQKDTRVISTVELATLDFEGSGYFDYWAQAYGAKIDHRPRPMLFEITTRVEERNYSRPAYNAEFSGDEIFLILSDHPRHDVRISLGTKVGWRDGFVVNALYQATINNSNSYGREFFEHSFGIESGIPLVWEINLHAKALLKLREHVQKTLLPQSSYLEEEEEGLSEMGLNLSRPLTENVRVEMGYQRFWQAYKYHSLKYQKNLLSAGVVMRF